MLNLALICFFKLYFFQKPSDHIDMTDKEIADDIKKIDDKIDDKIRYYA